MKRIALLLCCWGLLAPSVQGALTADWLLQDNAASTTVVAAVGSNGTYTNATNTDSIAGNPDGPGTALTRSFVFDGSNDYVAATTGNTAATQNKAFITLTAWFKCSTSDTTGTHPFVWSSVNGNTANARNVLLINTSGQIEARSRAGDAESVQTKTTTNSYDDGSWHHAAAVTNYAGDAITIYVDGVSVAQSGSISFTGTASANTASASVQLGWNNNSGQYFKGRLSRGSIYDSDESANLATIIAEKDTPGGGGSTKGTLQIFLQLSDDRAAKQQKHFEQFGVYGLYF